MFNWHNFYLFSSLLQIPGDQKMCLKDVSIVYKGRGLGCKRLGRGDRTVGSALMLWSTLYYLWYYDEIKIILAFIAEAFCYDLKYIYFCHLS